MINKEAELQQWDLFKSYGEFDKTFKRYITDLAGDVSSNKTPDRYLQIYEPERN